MKIWGEVPKISGIYDRLKSTSKVQKTTEVASKKDVVSISNEAKDFQTVLKAVRDIPDIRSEKINQYAEKYEAGNYDVSGKDIADKIIKNAFDQKA